jgi:hypothetical protein
MEAEVHFSLRGWSKKRERSCFATVFRDCYGLPLYILKGEETMVSLTLWTAKNLIEDGVLCCCNR